MNEPEKKSETGSENQTPEPVNETSKAETSTEETKTQPETESVSSTEGASEQKSERPAEGTVTAAYASTTEAAEPQKKSGKSVGTYLAFGLLIIILGLVLVFFLEKSDKLSTGVFDAYFERQAALAVVATVNGEEIIGRDLTTSVDQFSQAAIAQGVDVSNPQFKDAVREQSLEVLINTELLKQEATERGISVSDADIDARIETLETDLGGADVLDERIAELGIDRERLKEDVRDEIVIQTLLEQIFAEAEVAVTEEEVEAVYESAGGAEAGLPALEEVRPQVEAQIQASKEQEAIDNFIDSLRQEADIETM